MTSTSHMESIWSIIKAKIKNIYYVIPNKNLFSFIREAEYKYLIIDKTNETKILDFFECYELINNVSDDNISNYDYLD